jgi:hypothetical protein
MQLGQVAKFTPCTAFLTLDIPLTDSLWHMVKTSFGNVPTHGWLAKVLWLGGYTLAQLSLCFVPHHFLVSYCLWLCLILDIMKICTEFGPYGAFPSFVVLEMVDQQNSWNLLIIGTYLLYLEWNVGMLVANICFLWPPTPPHTQTLRSLLVPKQKKMIKSWGLSENSSAIIAQE